MNVLEYVATKGLCPVLLNKSAWENKIDSPGSLALFLDLDDEKF